MKVELDSKVYTDLLEIMEYYDGEGGPELAADFYAQFRLYAKAAGERPYSFPKAGGLRRVNLPKFSHHFLFQIVDDEIVRILIVKHDRRHPALGLDR
ncbi:MAG: hypothetical protein IPL32_14935 [Chloracidobacterium sp.]|nr:hypothetical protein [Chloracidobacterium sp.]